MEHAVAASPARAAAVLEQPLPGSLSVEAGRDRYLAENGFTVAAYSDRYTKVALGPLRFSVPNTPRHQWAIKLHDLHHVVTGYGTDLIGECEVSAWEARRGLGGLGLYVGWIVLSLALLGLAIFPRRTLAAWRASGSGARSLFGRPDLDYDALLALSVSELRTVLVVPEGGVNARPRRLHAGAPTA